MPRSRIKRTEHATTPASAAARQRRLCSPACSSDPSEARRGSRSTSRSKEKTMMRKDMMLGVLAMLLAIPGAFAQVNPESVQALKDMGAYLQTLKRFHVSTELTGERVLADGQKLQHAASANMDVERPGRIRVRMHSARSDRELFFDGKTVTLYTPAQKYYSTVEFSGTLGELVGKLQDGYDVELPLSDLFVWGTPAAPLDKIDSAMNAGQDFIDDDLCDHYAFRQGMFDWQI